MSPRQVKIFCHLTWKKNCSSYQVLIVIFFLFGRKMIKGWDMAKNCQHIHINIFAFYSKYIRSTKKFKNKIVGILKTDLGIPSNLQSNKKLKREVRFIPYEFFVFHSKCVRGIKKFNKQKCRFFITDLGVPLTFLLHWI